jgi:hypothetical protein
MFSSIDSARSQIVNIENSSEQQLQDLQLQQDFVRLGDRSQE